MTTVDDPRHWRNRAEEARLLAETVSTPDARATLLEIAEGYERLAKRAEERALQPRPASEIKKDWQD